MLNFNPIWRFTSPGTIATGVPDDFLAFIKKVATQHPNRQHVIEHYNRYFADAAGRPAYTSTSLSWAESDLTDYMHDAAANAPLFIEAFYDAGISMQMAHPQFIVPDVETINHILGKYRAGYELQPPALISRNPQATSIPVQERPPSLDEQAHEIIQRSLKQAEDDLAVGNGRRAVQEILWLLETVSTAFQGIAIGESTVQGKYFNNIADELRRHHRGQTVEQAINWMKTLHGYLSSPTGGGVRHDPQSRCGDDAPRGAAFLQSNPQLSVVLARRARTVEPRRLRRHPCPVLRGSGPRDRLWHRQCRRCHRPIEPEITDQADLRHGTSIDTRCL